VSVVKNDIDPDLGRPGSFGDDASTSRAANDTQVTVQSSMWRRIRRDVVLLGAGNVAIAIAQLCFRSILIAALVPADYGRLSLILGIYNTVWIIGASGLPNSVARYIAIRAPMDDSAIIRSAALAGAWPTIVATVIVAAVSGILLKSPIACLFAAIGLSSLVYQLLTMGILRGRGYVGRAASVMPIAAIAEVTPLAILWRSGIGVTPLSAFVVFCLGNLIGLLAGIFFMIGTTPRGDEASSNDQPLERAPSARQLLGFSMWLGAATAGVAILPLIIRVAAVLDSYTVVAVIDVAIVLISIPQRVGSVVVMAVTTHASRALHHGGKTLTISRRENLIAIVPFVLAALIVAFTPVVGWLFDALGRPEYSRSTDYLALALLAGPARILYGLVQGVLIAHGEGRFLAINSLSIATVASGMIFLAVALGSTIVAFAVFVTAFWAMYITGLVRVNRLESASEMPTNEMSASELSPAQY
jgi:O-antigen/teichoic acid export membrane protein